MSNSVRDRIEIIVEQVCNEAVVYGGGPDKQAFVSAILTSISEEVGKMKNTEECYCENLAGTGTCHICEGNKIISDIQELLKG